MAKRELIDTGTDKRYVRRDKRGRFKENDDMGRSLAADRRKKAKMAVKSAQGDRETGGRRKVTWSWSLPLASHGQLGQELSGTYAVLLDGRSF